MRVDFPVEKAGVSLRENVDFRAVREAGSHEGVELFVLGGVRRNGKSLLEFHDSRLKTRPISGELVLEFWYPERYQKKEESKRFERLDATDTTLSVVRPLDGHRW